MPSIMCLTVFMTSFRSVDDPYFGISTSSFSQKTLSVLMSPVNELDVEIKPDGMVVDSIPGSVI